MDSNNPKILAPTASQRRRDSRDCDFDFNLQSFPNIPDPAGRQNRNSNISWMTWFWEVREILDFFLFNTCGLLTACHGNRVTFRAWGLLYHVFDFSRRWCQKAFHFLFYNIKSAIFTSNTVNVHIFALYIFSRNSRLSNIREKYIHSENNFYNAT